MIYYLLIIACLLSFLVIGHILYTIINGCFISSSNYRSLFVKILIGLFSVVICYSCYKTGFKTINIGLLIFPIFIILKINSINRVNHFYIKNFLKILLNDIRLLLYTQPVFIFFFIWQFYFIICTSSIIPVLTIADNPWIAEVAMYLNKFGVETINLNYVDTTGIGNSPYHYFETWLVALIARLFCENYWMAIQMITIPLLQGIVVIGTWAIFEKFKLNVLVKIFSLIIIFISAFYFKFCANYDFFYVNYIWFLKFNAIEEAWALRLLIVYLILILASIFFIEKRHELTIIILLTLPILSINIAPTFLVLIVLITIINHFLKTRPFGNIKLWPVLYSIIVFLYIIIFYKLLKGSPLYDLPTMYDSFERIINNLSDLFNRIVIYDFIKTIFVGFVLYLPYLLMISLTWLFLKKKNNTRELILKGILLFPSIIFITLIFGISIILWIAFSYMFGAQEFFYYSFIPVINFFFFFVIYYVLFQSRLFFRQGVILKILAIAICSGIILKSLLAFNQSRVGHENRYSNSFLRSVQSEISHLNPVGVKMSSPDFFKDKDPYKFNPFANFSALYLHIFFNEFSLINLSFAGIIKIDDEFINQTKVAPINKFIKSQIKRNDSISTCLSSIDFIKKYKIQYLILDENACLDSCFYPYILRKYKDNLSKEEFVILNPY